MPEEEAPYLIIAIIAIVIIFLAMIIFVVQLKPEVEFGPFGFFIEAIKFLLTPRV